MSSCLVTGAARGIGLELCRGLRARGDTVIATCRSASPELAALSGVRRIEGLELTAPDASERLAREVAGVHLDLVVHNAGILARDGLADLDLAAIRAQLEVNALAPLRLTHALLPNLGRGSKLAFITSRMGSIGDNGSGGYYGYRMSKAALNAAAVSIARDLAPRGIAVVLLHPGFVRTGMTGGAGAVDPADAARDLIARIDELTIEHTGRFLHASGEQLPW
ncbi:MAG: SDR family oxidoreductase [Deltaproteobacteria bacterium]|nr:SDR family oxidoreductase [Deltaproteobacteria bacterium]